ncbi:MAG: response regulator [Thermodesulfobacteriota bacterium]|nr:response regulator [Thermodesulfobacteriota bacterium]
MKNFLSEQLAVQRASKLEDAQNEWKVIFNAIEEGISIHDTNFNILRANQRLARILNKKLSDLIGKRCYEVIHHLSEPLKGCPCLQAIETKKFANAEVKIPHLKGEFNISIYPLPNAEGGLKGFVHIMRDITEQKRLQGELVQLEKLSGLGELISCVAHELNNPLTSVIGYAQLLKGSKEVSEEIKEDLERLHDEAMRTSGIVQKFLAFARKRKSEKSYVNINEILRSTVALKSYDSKANNVAVVEDFQADLPRTMADPQQLQQIFLNLLTNAEYAMKEAHGRGRLEIQTRFDLERSLIRISFKDNGSGISEENLSKVFESFFTTKETGTGLGLNVSYKIVQEHGGTIFVKSRLGEGATFTVELPIIDLEEKIVEPEEKEEEGRVSGKKVLVIDDELLILDLVRNIFEREGIEVDTVSNGESALNKLKKRIYDLIIIDLKMPGLDGISLYQEIVKRNLKLSNRILFFTGDTSSSETRTFFEEIQAEYIFKPFDNADFLKSVKRILKKEKTQFVSRSDLPQG